MGSLFFAFLFAMIGVAGGFCLGYAFSQFERMQEKIRRLEQEKEASV